MDQFWPLVPGITLTAHSVKVNDCCGGIAFCEYKAFFFLVSFWVEFFFSIHLLLVMEMKRFSFLIAFGRLVLVSLVLFSFGLELI